MAKNTRILMNKSLNEFEEYKVLTIKESTLNDPAKKNETRKYLKRSIINFINDIIFWQSVDDSDINYCVDELLSGHACNIDSEDFWWA